MRVMELESHGLIRTKKTGEEMTVDEKRYQMVDDRTQTGEFQRGGRAAELKLAFLSIAPRCCRTLAKLRFQGTSYH